ncbi:alpha/beta fold hydrolase [Tritonibacter horizontis]|uniref:Soluble epoxide hydrolase n=1 Tax=Tritonibacter horizontis TaxID=1768241 RepID=A0A132C0S9_9RHOB|nr:alpha/beta hydrolase [Tritonibacter horizontis]KUP94188.1 soluble epoxide hydrolase [Tritonibacter horizontis]
MPTKMSDAMTAETTPIYKKWRLDPSAIALAPLARLQSTVWGLVAATTVLVMGQQSHADALSTFEDSVTHHSVSTSGVRIHYAEKGEGDTVLFLHGFPDHWLTWWRQMEALSKDHHVVAMDMRGFNLSDQPIDPEDYLIEKLITDVEAVVKDIGNGPVTLVGHDWGGFVAWNVAMQRPDLISRAGIVNIPHPWAMADALATNPAQEAASQYVDFFRGPNALSGIARDQISAWVSDPLYLERHNAAMDRSNLDAMLNYYRTLYPQRPYKAFNTEPPQITVPTLIAFGQQDPFLLVSGLSNTWNYVSAPLTISVWPDAGHFAQHDQPERLNQLLKDWISSN